MESDIEVDELTESTQIIETDKYDDKGDFQEPMIMASFEGEGTKTILDIASRSNRKFV